MTNTNKPDSEPVAWMTGGDVIEFETAESILTIPREDRSNYRPLYTHPATLSQADLKQLLDILVAIKKFGLTKLTVKNTRIQKIN